MKMIRTLIGLVLLLALITLQSDRIARAQYGTPTPGSGRGGQTQPTRQQPQQPAEWDYVADATEGKYYADYGDQGDPYGDWQYHHHVLYDGAKEAQVGWLDGHCVRTAPEEHAFCKWSLYGEEAGEAWTLNVYGLYSESSAESRYIAGGGTGKYAGAYGGIRWGWNEGRTEYYLKYEPVEQKQYEPLWAESDQSGLVEWDWDGSGNPYGNIAYWRSNAYQPGSDDPLGYVDGYCIRTAPNYAATCSWTLYNDEWTLTAAGEYREGAPAWLTVVGGTGAYAGANGAVRWERSGDRDYYQFNLNWMPPSLYKPYAYYAKPDEPIYYADLAADGEPGDVYYWHHPVYDESYERQLGYADGYCIDVAPGEWQQCTYTVYSDQWSLTASGYQWADGASTWSLTGGSGAYLDAEGDFWYERSEDGDVYTFDGNVYPHTYWTNIKWAQIGPEDRADWNKLGWSVQNWDNPWPAGIPDSTLKYWDQLTDTERAAAERLGYIKDYWDAAAPRKPEDPDALWNTIGWDQLWKGEQKLWGILGWDQYSWNLEPSALIPASEGTPWDALWPEQRAAAEYLGYTQESWDASNVRAPEGDVNEYWTGYGWDDLYYSEQRLWGYLGWNRASWQEEIDPPASYGKTYEQLSAVEQAAAGQLGYDQASWDAGK